MQISRTPMVELSSEECLAILDYVEKSQFDFFELTTGDLRLVVSKTPLTEESLDRLSALGSTRDVSKRPSARSRTPDGGLRSSPSTSDIQSPTKRHPASGLVPVVATGVGTFYAQANPGAPPFIKVGSRVDEDTTVGLIEMMKVFNAVKAKVKGVVEAILVADTDFVEFGQSLLLVKPDKPNNGGKA